MTPGERIKAIRTAKKWSQQKLADEMTHRGVPITRAAIAQWESGGTKNQRPDNLMAAASALGTSMEELLTGKLAKKTDIHDPLLAKEQIADYTVATATPTHNKTKAESIAERVARLPDNSPILDAIELMLNGARAGGAKPKSRPASSADYGTITGTRGK